MSSSLQNNCIKHVIQLDFDPMCTRAQSPLGVNLGVILVFLGFSQMSPGHYQQDGVGIEENRCRNWRVYFQCVKLIPHVYFFQIKKENFGYIYSHKEE
jgi:hypothetical protein